MSPRPRVLTPFAVALVLSLLLAVGSTVAQSSRTRIGEPGLPGRTPALDRFSIAGFVVDVTSVAPVRDVHAGASGKGTLTWTAAGRSMTVPVRFDRIDVGRAGRDGIPPAMAGSVGLDGVASVTLDLDGHAVLVRELRADPSGARADLEYTLPAGLGGQTVRFDDVEVRDGGSFTAVTRFGPREPDRPGVGGVDLRIAGARLVLDFDGGVEARGEVKAPARSRLFRDDLATRTKIGAVAGATGSTDLRAKPADDGRFGDLVDSGAVRLPGLPEGAARKDPAWTGVALGPGIVRVPVRPPTAPADASLDLFFVERPESGFLFGRFDLLEIAADGAPSGTGLRAVPPALIRPFAGPEPDDVLPLFLPAGFGLEIRGGSFDLEGGRVAAVDLHGRIHLPAEFGSGPLGFAHLQRAENPQDGFVTEELVRGLPGVALGEFAYRPARGRLQVPGLLLAASNIVRVDLGPMILPPDGPEELAAWQDLVRDRIRGAGLLLWGGVVTTPWPEAPEPPARGNPPPAPAPVRPIVAARPVSLAGVEVGAKPGLGRVDVGGAIDRIREDPGSIRKIDVGGDPSPSPGRIPSGSPTKKKETDDGKPESSLDRMKRLLGRGEAVLDPRLEARGATGVSERGRLPGLSNLDRLKIGTTPPGPIIDRARALLHAPQGGAFLLEAGGTEGTWISFEDPGPKRVGSFTAEVDRVELSFRQSSLENGLVFGRLLVPYPSNVEIPFHGRITVEGDVLVAEDGLVPPPLADGWFLDYWRVSVFPKVQAGPVDDGGGGPAIGTGKFPVRRGRQDLAQNVRFADGASLADGLDASELERARQGAQGSSGGSGLRLDMADRAELGRIAASDDLLRFAFEDLVAATGKAPLDPGPRPALLFYGDRIVVPLAEMRLDVAEAFGGLEFRRTAARDDRLEERPFLISMDILPDGELDGVELRPAGGLTFLELPFHPRRSSLQMRRYVGDHRPPEANEAPLPTWLVRVEGDLEFGLFGRREVRIHHTAMGARVPFVEPTAKDEQGRPAPVVADSAGAIYVDARLRFVNTFGVPDESIRRVFPNPPVPPEGVAYDVPPRAQVGPIPFKAFLGEAEIAILKALSMNGLAEAGVWMDVTEGLRAYEKVGFGGGVDVVKAVLAVLRGLETVAELGGAAVEVTTGAEGLGAEVVHVVVDATQFVSSVATTAVAIAGAVGSGGGSTAHLADEIRNLIGNGLELSASSVDLAKAIYEQEPWYEAPDGFVTPEDPKLHPPYVAMEIADILLTASAAGVQFEELEPRKIASILLQSLDTGMPILRAMEVGDVEADRKIDAALVMSHALVRTSRDLIDHEQVREETVWEVLAMLVEAADLIRQFEEVRELEEVERPLALAVRIADVSVQIARAIRIGDGDFRMASLVDLTDQILTLMCENYDQVAPLVGDLGGDSRDLGNLLGLGQTTFQYANHPDFLDGTLPPERAVTQILVPMLDDLADGRPAGACAVSYAPYDAEVRALLRVARQVLSVARFADEGAVSNLEGQVALYDWSLGTVQETLRAVDVLQPGSVDDRVLATVGDFRAAGEAIEPGRPPVAQVLGVVEALMPTVRRAIDLVPDIDPTVPRMVDVVAASVSAARPIADGNEQDVGLWLQGSIDVLDKVRRLPLRRDVLAGVQVATRSLELARDAEKGTLTPRGLVSGAREIVDTVRDNAPGLVPGAAPRLASIDAAAIGHAIPAALDPMPVLDIASALLASLESTMTDGEFTVATVGRLLVAVAEALAPGGGFAGVRGPDGIVLAANGAGSGFASLGSALRALPLLDPTTDAPTAARAVIDALLEAELEAADDVRVVEGVRRARLALEGLNPDASGTRPDHRLMPAPPARNVAQSDDADVRREVGIPTDFGDGVVWPFTVEYPEGHPDFPGGLREVYRVDDELVQFYEQVGGLADASLARLEVELQTRGVRPVRRVYRDAAGREVTYAVDDPDIGATVTVRDATTASGPFVERRTVVVSQPPVAGQAADAIQGALVEAVWRTAPGGPWATHRVGSGLVRIDEVAGPGSFAVREVPADVQPQTVGTVPLGGRLLAYRGPDPRLGAGVVLDWRAGDPFVLIVSGRSYDRRAADPALVVSSPAELPLSGDAVERRVHLGDEEGYWLFRVGETALRVEPCGTWALHDLALDELGFVAPDPTALLPVSEAPLATGDATGAVFRPDGTPMPEDEAERLWIFRVLVTETGEDVTNVMARDMEKLLQAAAGFTGLAPDSGRRRVFVSACAEDGSFAEGFTDGLVEEVRTVGTPNAESTRATYFGMDRLQTTVVRAGERVTTTTGRADGVDVVEIAPATDPAATCASGAAAGQTFRYRIDSQLVIARWDAIRMKRPERRDRAGALRLLETRRLVEERSSVLQEPTLEQLDRFVRYMREARLERRTDEGAQAQSQVAIAATLSKLLAAVVEEIEAAANDPSVGRAWIAAGAGADTPIDRLLRVLGHAEESAFEISPRVYAAVARALPGLAGDDGALAVLQARLVAAMGNRCDDRETIRRVQGLRALAGGLKAAHACSAEDAIGARAESLFVAFENAENACIDQVADDPDATEDEILDRVFDAIRRKIADDEAGRPSTFDNQKLDRVVDRLIDREAERARAIAADPARSRADSDRAIRRMFGIHESGTLLGAGTRSIEAMATPVVETRLERQRGEMDARIEACGVDDREGCDPSTLEGCSLASVPECDPDLLDRDIRNLVEDKGLRTVVSTDEDVEPIGEDAPRVLDILRARTAVAIEDMERGFDEGDVDRFRRGVHAIGELRTGAEVFSSSDDGNDWGNLGLAALRRVQTRFEQVLGEGDPSDDRVRMGLETALLAREHEVERSSLVDLLRPRIEALETRDRERALALASAEGALYPASERIARSMLESTRARVTYVDGVGGAKAIAVDAVLTVFREGLRDNRGALLAAPVPDPDPLATQVDVPVPGVYPSAVLQALLVLHAQPGANDALRREAASYYERVALRFQPYIPSHRSALKEWVDFGKSLLEQDASRRAGAGRDPVRTADDPMVRALQVAARRVGDTILALQLGTAERERADELARSYAATADAREEALQSDPDLVDADPEFRAQIEEGVQFLRDLSIEAQERADAMPFSSFEDGLGSDDARRAIDTLAFHEPEIVALAAESGSIVSAVSLSALSGADPWEAAAVELDVVSADAGPDARLALRLLRGLPDPEAAGELEYRFAAVPEIAGFVVEELGLVEPEARGAQPAILGAGSPSWDPQALLESVLALAIVPPGSSPGRELAGLTATLLEQAGADTEDPVVRVGLQVGSAAVDGAAVALQPAVSGREIPWLDVLEEAGTRLADVDLDAGRPEDVWLALSGRSLRVGARAARGEIDEALLGEALAVTLLFLDQPQVVEAIETTPEPGRTVLVTTRQVIDGALSGDGGDEHVDVALARAIATTMFDAVEGDYVDFGRALAGWSLDFADDHHDLLTEIATSGEPDRDQVQRLVDAMLLPSGAATLACVVQDHVPTGDVTIPPALTRAPLVAMKELLRSSVDGDEPEDRAKAMVDVSAGLLNLTLSPAGASTCDDLRPLPEEDVGFARSVRGLKNLELDNPAEAFRLIGLVGVGAVDTFLPGTTWANVMRIVWYGDVEPPPPNSTDPGTGLQQLLMAEPFSADFLETAMNGPKVAAKVVTELSDDPAMRSTMALLGGKCTDDLLLPPDRCLGPPPGAPNTPTNQAARTSSTLPNALLGMLGGLRRQIAPELTRELHRSHPQYGYLRTIPVLAGDGSGPSLARFGDQVAWDQTMANFTDIENAPESAKRASLAAVDLSRMAVDAIVSLTESQAAGVSAEQIINESVFAPQIGGEMFSGVAGGLMREWPPGEPEQADLYFELIGTFVIPALVRSATQLTFQTAGGDWALMLRAAGNYPDLDAVGRAIGIDIPFNDIGSAVLNKQEMELTGWLGVANDELYAQLYTRGDMRRGASTMQDFTMSGFVRNFPTAPGVDPGVVAANLDLGLCGQLEQQVLINNMDPQMSFLTMGLGATIRMGGFMAKRDGIIEVGYKIGSATEWNVPGFPVAGIRFGLDLGASAAGGMSELDFNESDDATLAGAFGSCVSPFLSGYFFGIELEEVRATLDVEFFGTTDLEAGGASNTEVGMLLSFEIPEELEGVVGGVMGCPANPAAAEVCAVVADPEEPLLGWMAFSNTHYYLGLGPKPANGNQVVGGEIVDGVPRLPGLVTVNWQRQDIRTTGACDPDMCIDFLGPPPGVSEIGPPSTEVAP